MYCTVQAWFICSTKVMKPDERERKISQQYFSVVKHTSVDLSASYEILNQSCIQNWNSR